MSRTAEERRALVDHLAAQLQARVLSGELPSGTRLRQEALAEEFGVSRTPVREALRKLQAGGVVELQPHRGAFVRGLSPREIRDAYEVRASLEALAAQLAATRVTRQQLVRLRAAQEEFRKALALTLRARGRDGGRGSVGEAEVQRWGAANNEFHQAIHDASGNCVLAGTLAHLHRNFPRDLSGIVVGESSAILKENVGQHEAILAAIEDRDADAARDLMFAHIRNAGDLVTLRFEQRAAAAAEDGYRSGTLAGGLPPR